MDLLTHFLNCNTQATLITDWDGMTSKFPERDLTITDVASKFSSLYYTQLKIVDITESLTAISRIIEPIPCMFVLN